MDRSAFEKELEIERALQKIAMEKALEKSDESDFYEIVKIIRKEGDEEMEEEINENGIDKKEKKLREIWKKLMILFIMKL